MIDAFDPDPAAEALERAWRTGHQMSELPAAIRPRTLAEGYDVQDRLIARMDQEIVGWKLGVGSRAAKRRAGIERALAGRILGPRCFRAPAIVPVPNRAPLTIEIEIGFVLVRDIMANEVIGDPADVIAAAHLTSELVLSRFVDRQIVGWPSFVADNAASHALVIGPSIELDEIGGCIATLAATVDGVPMARLPPDEQADPLAGFGDLLSLCHERHLTLRAGQVVSTGAILRPFVAGGADLHVAARCGTSGFEFQTRYGS